MPRVYPQKTTKFCFTKQVPDGVSWAVAINAMEEKFNECQHVVFALFQCEIAPTTQQRHLQGCFKVDNPRSHSWAVEHLLQHSHVEMCRNWNASVKYCRKDETRAPGTTPTIIGDVSEDILEKHGYYDNYVGSFYYSDEMICRELYFWDDDLQTLFGRERNAWLNGCGPNPDAMEL